MSDNKQSFDSNKSINIERLCRLCRLSPDGESEQSAAELKKMADYTYPRLCRVDTALPFSYCRADGEHREDVATNSGMSKDILTLAPCISDGYISVPKVIRDNKEEADE